MIQPVPNAPMPADDFLISDDTDLDAASQWLLGIQAGASEPLVKSMLDIAGNDDDAHDALDLFEQHPDILPDPVVSPRVVLPKLSASLHPAILPDFDLPSDMILDDSIVLPEWHPKKTALPQVQPQALETLSVEYLDDDDSQISEPDILEDVSSGYIIADDEPVGVVNRPALHASILPDILPDSDEQVSLSFNAPQESPDDYSGNGLNGLNPKASQYQQWRDEAHASILPDMPAHVPIQKPRQWIDLQNPQSLWGEVLERLQSQMTKPSFETWIAPLRLTGVAEDRVTLAVDSEFNRDWVLKKYRALLTEAFSSRLERMVMIHLDVDDSPAQAAPPVESYQELPESVQKIKPGKKQSVWTPRTAQSNLNPKYTFDTFIVGTGNRFCHAAALAVAETPAQSYNPFFIYGGVGLGKTHIMQAIAHFAHQHHPEMAVRYVTAEQFTNELINAITGKTMKAFRDRYRKNDILIIDDIQFLEGKERTQEEIFHTFNALHQSGKQIILSSDRAPRYLSQLEDRLRSRFEWGLITDIQPADFETRLAILKSKVKRDHFHVPDDVLVFIAEGYPNNIRELEGALNKVTAYAMLTKTILDLATAKHLLGANQQEPTQISKEKIIEVVAEYYHLSAADLKSPSRAKDVSHARQVSIYVLRRLTEASFPKIGDLLGGRKHTTILYAYEKMKEELERHPNLAQQVQEITGRVKAPS